MIRLHSRTRSMSESVSSSVMAAREDVCMTGSCIGTSGNDISDQFEQRF